MLGNGLSIYLSTSCQCQSVVAGVSFFVFFFLLSRCSTRAKEATQNPTREIPPTEDFQKRRTIIRVLRRRAKVPAIKGLVEVRLVPFEPFLI